MSDQKIASPAVREPIVGWLRAVRVTSRLDPGEVAEIEAEAAVEGDPA